MSDLSKNETLNRVVEATLEDRFAERAEIERLLVEPVSLSDLRNLTDAMPPQSEPAEDFVRRMRDGDRY